DLPGRENRHKNTDNRDNSRARLNRDPSFGERLGRGLISFTILCVVRLFHLDLRPRRWLIVFAASGKRKGRPIRNPAVLPSISSIQMNQASTQSNVRVTAFFQNLYCFSLLAEYIFGVHSLSLPQ